MAKKVILHDENDEQIYPMTSTMVTAEATFTDFDDLANGGMNTYSGRHFVKDTKLLNSPFDGWYSVEVIPGSSEYMGEIHAISFWDNVKKYTSVNNGKIVGWKEIATSDTKVLTNPYDLNTLTEPGMYKFALTSAAGQLNGPDLIKPVHNIEVKTYADGSISQVLTDLVDNTEYVRTKSGTTNWSIWKLVKGQTPWVKQPAFANVTENSGNYANKGVYIRFTPEAMEMMMLHVDFGTLSNNNQVLRPDVPAMYYSKFKEKNTLMNFDIQSDFIDGGAISDATGPTLYYNLGVVWGARSNHTDITFQTRFRYA